MPPTPSSVDVIIPVHGAPGPFRRCVESVLRHTDLRRHRLVVVVDGPTAPGIEASVETLTALAAEVLVLRNGERKGFVLSVNRALRGSERDAVLLNSDTRVSARWLEKLRAAAYSRPDAATATPFSNNATICSLPRFLAENTIPTGFDVDSFASLVERCSERRYPELPTGVGVCLFVKRRVLDEVGLLDEGSFGMGYGEESELCMRATRAGYCHLLDDATFIYHEGQRSFGTSRRRRVKRAHRVMRRRHPEYLRAVADFIGSDPLKPLRERVVSELRPARRKLSPGLPGRILHVVHGWPPWNPAGTEVYARSLATRQALDREVVVYARMSDPDRELGDAIEHVDRGVRVRLVVNNFVQRDPLSRNALHDRLLVRDFERLLDEVRPELVHVHHLAGHGATLVGGLRRRRIPWVYQVQDWWPLCARANLWHRDGRLCTGPGAVRCSLCLPMTRLPGASLWSPWLYVVRAGLAKRALKAADALLMGSRFIESSYRELGFLPRDVPVHVIPYGVEVDRSEGFRDVPGRDSSGRRPLVCGFVGSILPHKGAHVAVEAFREIPAGEAELQIWGDLSADPAYSERLESLAAGAPVVFRGRFDEARKGEVLRGFDLLLVPSLGFESFGLVAREALAVGVPVLASRRSALVELFQGAPAGAFFEAGDSAALARAVREAARRPEVLDSWRGNVPEVKTMEGHAREVDGVYAEVLRRAGRR
jgi:glycosyltransferase involved in cell wall biosynthesis